MKEKIYEAPQCEDMELALEQAVLQSSIPDFGDGGPL